MSGLSVLIGAVVCGLSVVAGAFGSHALKAMLDAKDLAIFETAVRYQFFHGLALIGLGLFEKAYGVNGRVAMVAFIAGVILFSGSLYVLVLSGVRTFGAVTPLGGVAFLVGWGAWAMLAWKT
jgi:uncharacterized membrane protein YgdD (TMEM256/DUF423 family)